MFGGELVFQTIIFLSESRTSIAERDECGVIIRDKLLECAAFVCAQKIVDDFGL